MATQAVAVAPEESTEPPTLALVPPTEAAPEAAPAEAAALAPIIVIKKIMPGHGGAHGERRRRS